MNHADGVPGAAGNAQHSGAPEEMVSLVRQRLVPVDRFVREQVRRRPLAVLAVALGLGYVIGRLIRRA